MDLSRSRPTASSRRLPRTRGDGPLPPRVGPGRQVASPHTRGWTHPLDRPPHLLPGFPAHAGMDPGRRSTGAPSRWLPRTRGDGPDNCAYRDSARRASPHTRGWTHSGGADAGGAPGLPRTRGDGPWCSAACRARSGASPHTRGWTASGDHQAIRSMGFPAHAGMDPAPAPGSSHPQGLPRTRGDGPVTSGYRLLLARASPHTRGWTRVAAGLAWLAGGFPAHAGMDPRPAQGEREPGRLPRTRGDGPLQGLLDDGGAGASPHTRGWTVTHDGMPTFGPGFPAHAGMDPASTGPRPGSRRLPRTRGDGPVSTAARQVTIAASPHTRGWTRPARRYRPRRLGFPAHAGMDPAEPSRPRPSGRLPRTRGDGPQSGADRPALGLASPHTRGWTRHVDDDGVAGLGFPAHAGMDPSPAAR